MGGGDQHRVIKKDVLFNLLFNLIWSLDVRSLRRIHYSAVSRFVSSEKVGAVNNGSMFRVKAKERGHCSRDKYRTTFILVVLRVGCQANADVLGSFDLEYQRAA